MIESLISVIVPVYNAEQYLEKCIESIINQTYKNLEIIIIDDGSTDKSPEICDKYAAKDVRINLVHKENGGVSSARNAGLDVFKGEYVTFVDSDDFISYDYVEKLYCSVIENSADISICNYKINGNKRHKLNRHGKTPASSFIYDYLSLTIETDECWGKLFNKSVVDSIRFDNYKVSEDSLFVFYCLINANFVSFVDEYLYCYRVHNESVINQSNAEKRYEACLTAQVMLEHCENTPYCNKYISASKTRLAKYNFFVYFIAQKENNTFIMNKCKKYILKNRKKLLLTRGVSPKVKIACFSSCFGLNFLTRMHRLLKGNHNDG